MTQPPIPKSGKLPALFALGVILGFAGGFFLAGSLSDKPVIPFQGTVKVDSTSHEDPLLTNVIYLDNPTVTTPRLHLRFRNDREMNEALGKAVTVRGKLKTLELGNGDVVPELHVTDFQVSQHP